MKLQIDATPEELVEKSDQLVESLSELLRPAAPDLAAALEKALPRKEAELKFPVLQALQKKEEAAYDKQLGLMLKDIGKVLDRSVQKAVEEVTDLQKGGPYIGPKGGKWADPKHTIPWKETGKKQSPIEKLEGKTSIVEYGNKFETGKPVTFTFVRSTEAAPKLKPGMEDRFQQRVEPAGRYMTIVSENTKPFENQIMDTITFNKPIVLKGNTGESQSLGYDKNSWKMNLSRAFGGKKGKALSKAVAAAGYDGIVSVGKHGTSETVDLRFLHTGVIEKSMGPFTGPRGGKWADSAHTIPWHEETGSGGHLDALKDHLQEKFGVSLWMYSHGDKLNLAKIVVPKEKRNEGTGSKVMSVIKAYADKYKKTITLSPSTDFGGSKGKLIKFYKRHGFVENKGKKKDYEISEAMYRLPGVQKALSPDYSQRIVAKEEKNYDKVKEELMERGYLPTDFEEGGVLYGYSTNQLIDLIRDKKDATSF